ncbi:MAG: circularly permuted type 2 ATP-grasp protein, partial [Actinomycetota bacterium]
ATGSPAAASLIAAIAQQPDLATRQLEADRLLASEGAGHIVHDLPIRADGRSVSVESRPWRLDPIPFAVDGEEFSHLTDRVIARMAMLEAVLDDLYGDRSLLARRVVDPHRIWSSQRYRVAAIGHRLGPRWLTSYAVDVIRDRAGEWHVVKDFTDAPAGLGYTMLGRSVIGRVQREAIAHRPPGSSVRSIATFTDHVRDALADIAGTDSPRIVVLSGGVEHRSFVGQSYVATELGLNLADGADLVVRKRRLWLRSLGGLEPVDVLYRRLEDDRLDPMEVNTEGSRGIPGVLQAARAGGVRLANAHGSGVLEDPVLADMWDEAGEWVELRRPRTAGEQIPDVGPLRRLDAAARGGFVADLVPGFDGTGVVDRPVVMRLQVVAGDRGVEVMQGGSARVLATGDDPGVPTSATAKDVWVVGGTVAPPRLVRRRPLPQVDLLTSVPTRAAEALYWSGRAMERGAFIARSLDVVLDRTSGVVDAPTAEPWVGTSLDMVATIAGNAATVRDEWTTTMAVGETLAALAQQLGSLLAEVSSVREYFSTTAGRAFARLASTRATLQDIVEARVEHNEWADPAGLDADVLDAVLIDLASLEGLWSESIVRGPAWRFGEIGRRVERVFGVIDAVRGAFMRRVGAAWPFDHVGDAQLADYDRRRLVELILAVNESLVAYRRRHRSDVDLSLAARLIVADERNPRAAAAALRVIEHESIQLGWDDGARLARDGMAILGRSEYDDVEGIAATLDDLWGVCDRIARLVVTTHLVTPVDPRPMGWRSA